MDNAEVQRTNWDFVVGDNAASKVGDVFWFGPLKPIAKLIPYSPAAVRKPGLLKGRVRYGDDLRDPLPPEIASAFLGEEP